MTLPVELFILFGTSVLMSSVGFYRFRYFVTLGYGLSIAACSVVLLLLFHEKSHWALIAACGVLIFHGCRIALDVIIRDGRKTAKGRRRRGAMNPEPGDMGLGIMLWIGCGALYALMNSSVCYRFVSGGKVDISVYIGIVLIALGALACLYAAASRWVQTKRSPGEICSSGLYRFIRYPNSVGEVTIWTGVMLLGITAFKSPGQWIIAGIGYIGALCLTFGITGKQDRKPEGPY